MNNDMLTPEQPERAGILRTADDLSTALEALPLDETWSVAVSADGSRQLSSPLCTLALGYREGPAPELIVRARVADLPDAPDLAPCLEDLLAGNFFWRPTDGATLSLSGDAVYLAERRDAAVFTDNAIFKDFLEHFIEQVVSWRERIALSRSPEEPTTLHPEYC